ncbi:MAG: hypothetical protein IT529_08750 [Burkholderiales bacterium]|nr:hypothetical protein [Burkholderiales bacterium]
MIRAALAFFFASPVVPEQGFGQDRGGYVNRMAALPHRGAKATVRRRAFPGGCDGLLHSFFLFIVLFSSPLFGDAANIRKRMANAR